MHSDHPILQLDHLDTLWFQVAGTLCNLRCNHCFISCSPENHTLELMSFDQILPYLAEAIRIGVKEFYFTGGEPFINPDLPKILEATLRIGPATVLTNATLFNAELVKELAAMRDSSLYSLEFRVSIDGFSPETNDPIRGEGTFARAMSGVAKLVAHDFLPIITAARTWPLEDEREVVSQFVAMLKEAGYARPRLKIL